MSPDPDPLAILAQRVRWEMETLAYPAGDWVRPVPGGHQVAIVGAGQSGIALALALRRARIDDVVLLDALPEGASQVWTGFARMHTLRTPRHVLGPEMGIPSLSVRAWYEARFGTQAWAALRRIPRGHWQEYLDWLRATLGLSVRWNTRVHAITPGEQFSLATSAGEIRARHVVLATGIDGLGAWTIPPALLAIPGTHRAHTADPIDFAALAGRRVLVLGAGASAFDNAATALEAGAAGVTMLVRRTALPRVNPYRWMEFPGFLNQFAELPDRLKWAFMRRIFGMNQPPPQDTYSRCAVHPNFQLLTGAPVRAARFEDGQIALDTPRGVFAGDFLIIGTGFAQDLSARPELAAIAPHPALWRDRFTPPAGEEDAVLGGFPYLDPSFAFTGDAPWLSRLRACTFGAMLSNAGAGGISPLGPTIRRIAAGIEREIFLSQAEGHLADLHAYAEPELTDLRLASDPGNAE